ncbi:two component histidine kinase 1 [Glonium stellatum]|uniref:Two component histidine kinase 1 n=1 Tax=Glonium stellatum TaxID=574774 RepID=A0A8E2EPV0_9PEZI|nr:two component histidine kinase 1 [Glonium stellatum]
MENLDKLTAAGCSLFDLNTEYLDRTDWPQTNIGARETWPQPLSCFVNLIITFPHPACVFWGNELVIIHNLAWGKACGDHDGQGANVQDRFSGEALGAIHTSIRGHTVKVAGRFFLSSAEEHERDAPILLSTLLDENGSRQGVLAQLLHAPTVQRSLGTDLVRKANGGQATRTKKPRNTRSTKEHKNPDTSQTQLFQRFAELLPTGLAILDSDAEAVFVNDDFFKLTTNKTAKDFRAWPESIDTRDYDRVMGAYRDAFSSRKELRVEFRCAASPEEQWRLFLLRPLRDDSETSFICAIIDITEIKHAELAQEKAANEAQERKGQQERFIDMVSHEIRNPLSAVMHLAEEIKKDAQIIGAHCRHEQLSDIADAADTILLCVSHQSVLVDDILSFSKLDSMMLSLIPRIVQPKIEFSKSLGIFRSEFKAKNIDFEYALDISYQEQGVDYVMADLNRMKQVLVNLITNAVKFTAKKDGERHISVIMGATVERPTSYPPNIVFFETKEDACHIDSTRTAEWGQGSALYLMVAIKDTGIGINAENQAKLFERFRQATPKTQETYGGSGLGLFISRKLCQLHGGDIGVSSKEGEGSTFAFFFRVRHSEPLSEDENTRPKRTKSMNKISGGITTPLENPQNSKPSCSCQSSKGNGVSERPKIRSLASQPGIDSSEIPQSLKDSLVQFQSEAHTEANSDSRSRKTEEIAENIEAKRSPMTEAVQSTLPESLKHGTKEVARQPSAADEIIKQQSEKPTHSGPTILLVEDNLINQKVLRRQLQSRGFIVYVASNGQEAIEAVKAKGKERDNKQNYFDCILMDQEMPIKDGNTATKEIREIQKRGEAGYGPILGVSANVREAQTNSMVDAGMDEVINKPFKVDELVERIEKLLYRNN